MIDLSERFALETDEDKPKTGFETMIMMMTTVIDLPLLKGSSVKSHSSSFG